MFDEAIHELENLSKFALSNQLVQSHPWLLPTLIKCSISSSTTKMAPKSPIWRPNLEEGWKSSFWCFSFPALKLGSLPLTSVQRMLLCWEFDNGLLARGQPPTKGNIFICGNSRIYLFKVQIKGNTFICGNLFQGFCEHIWRVLWNILREQVFLKYLKRTSWGEAGAKVNMKLQRLQGLSLCQGTRQMMKNDDDYDDEDDDEVWWWWWW